MCRGFRFSVQERGRSELPRNALVNSGAHGRTAHKVESGKFHIIEVECRKQKVVTMATFSAECHAAIAAAETLLLMGLAMTEVINGPLPTREAFQWRDDGTPTLCLKNHLIIDAMPLMAAVSAEQVRAPA